MPSFADRRVTIRQGTTLDMVVILVAMTSKPPSSKPMLNDKVISGSSSPIRILPPKESVLMALPAWVVVLLLFLILMANYKQFNGKRRFTFDVLRTLFQVHVCFPLL